VSVDVVHGLSTRAMDLEEIMAVRSSDEVASLIGNRELFPRRRNETQFGDVCPLLQGQGHCHQRFNACAIDLAVALCRVAVATGEECTGHIAFLP